MIVSLTGLGGSGKSTVLKFLEKEIPSFKKIHYPSKLVLIPFIQMLKQKLGLTKKKLSQETSYCQEHKKQNSLFVILKAIFFLIDSWLIWLFKLKYAENNIIICDRYIYDYLVYYYSLTTYHFFKRIIIFLARTAPPVDIIIYLNALPEVAINRKYEWPIELLKQECEIRQIILKILNVPIFILDATKPPDILAKALKEAISLCKKNNAIDQNIFFLLSLFDFDIRHSWYYLFSTLKPNVDELVQSARKNYLCYALSKKMHNDMPQFYFNFEKLAQERREKWKYTLNYIEKLANQSCFSILIIKDFLESHVPRLPSDIDLCIRFQDIGKATDSLNVLGSLELIEPHKYDWRNNEFLSVDLYMGSVYSSGLLMIQEDFLWKKATKKGGIFYPSSEAQILLIIEHSINETTLITLFDLLQVKNLIKNKIDLKILFDEANKHGWRHLLELWLSFIDTTYKISNKSPIILKSCTYIRKKKNLSFPLHLPLLSILHFWNKRVFSNKNSPLPLRILRLFTNAIKALRIWRIRCLGKIPFHNYEI